MIKFEEERISEFKIETSRFDSPIPGICIKPKEENDSSVVFIFNGGLASTNAIIKYMNFFVYDNNWLISYEKAGHGENNNIISQYRGQSLKELDTVVEWVRINIPNRRIYLLGESWGSQINLVYYVKNKHKIAGTVNWNAPLSIKDTEERSKEFMKETKSKILKTLFLNKNLYLPKVQSDTSAVTSDILLQRALMLQGSIKESTRASINIWRFLHPTYRVLKKYGKNPEYNFLYIQSGDDHLADWNKIKKLENRYFDQNHYLFMSKGKHILSFEPDQIDELYKTIYNFINK